MFKFLRQNVSPDKRVQLMQILPKGLRHRIVDLYLQQSQRNYKRFLQTGVIGVNNKPPAQFWGSGITDESSNAPKCYAGSQRRFDVDRLLHYAQTLGIRGKILEFGCNAGRALHYFTDAGYSAIGVEINAHAVEVGKGAHPSLHKAQFHIGDGEFVLPQLPDAYVDLGYTTAVLRHISPKAIDAIVAQLCRIVNGYFITIEDEGTISPLSFPHDYQSLFRKHGGEQISFEYGVDWPGFSGSAGTVLRVFTIRANQ
jgi:SAM-dependent methyltransferase